MGEHEEQTPTQIKHPNQAALRTAAATAAGQLVTLLTIASTLLVVAPQILDEIDELLPESWVAWLTAAVASLSIIVGAITRVMALPAVNDFLARLRLGVVPRQEG